MKLKLKGCRFDTSEEIQAELQSAWHSDRTGRPGSVPKMEMVEPVSKCRRELFQGWRRLIGLMVSFMIFTASVRKILDQPLYSIYIITYVTSTHNLNNNNNNNALSESVLAAGHWLSSVMCHFVQCVYNEAFQIIQCTVSQLLLYPLILTSTSCYMWIWRKASKFFHEVVILTIETAVCFICNLTCYEPFTNASDFNWSFDMTEAMEEGWQMWHMKHEQHVQVTVT
jgi:hypothetical protein